MEEGSRELQDVTYFLKTEFGQVKNDLNLAMRYLSPFVEFLQSGMDFENKEKLLSTIKEECESLSVRADPPTDASSSASPIAEIAQRTEKCRRLAKLGLQLQKQSLSPEEMDACRAFRNRDSFVTAVTELCQQFREGFRTAMETKTAAFAEEFTTVFCRERRALRTTRMFSVFCISKCEQPQPA